MASNALLLLVGVPENYRLGGPAFQRLHQAQRVARRVGERTGYPSFSSAWDQVACWPLSGEDPKSRNLVGLKS